MTHLLTAIKQCKKYYPQGIDKLEFGSGNNPEPGYTHLDILSGSPHLEIFSNVRKTPLPNNFVQDHIRAVHLMEHFCHPQFSSPSIKKKVGTTVEVLKEAYRILKPGGKLKIVTPDLEKIAQSIRSKSISPDYLQQWLMGGHQNEYDIHHWIWTHDDARKWFKEAGFKQLSDWNPVQGKRAWKLRLMLKFKKIYQPPHPLWFDVEWFHWLFFEGTKP